MANAPYTIHPPSNRFINALVARSDGDELEVGDVVECYEDEAMSGAVVSFDDDDIQVRTADGETLELPRDDSYVRDRPAVKGLWEAHLQNEVPDGVAWTDTLKPALRDALRAGFDALMAGPADYHPGSNGVVRDLLHPSLYPYVRPARDAGASESAAAPAVVPVPKGGAGLLARLKRALGGAPGPRGVQAPLPPLGAGAPVELHPDAGATDFWGRPYEDSVYQWLPTPFRVEANGLATVDGAINNLPRETHGALYDALGRLFTAFLPLFEGVYGYGKEITFYDDSLEGEHELPETPGTYHADGTGPASDWNAVSPAPLRDRELQVITKIVEYKLEPGQSHEGVWHVEGMSHENILATGVCILDRDPDMQGGALRFKRAYTTEEAGRLFWNVPQCRPESVDDMVDEGLIPVGSLETPAGRLLVFPNSHVHKLSTLSVPEDGATSTRRVIVFWLVNPETQIVSTRDVPPATARMSHEEALAARLALMEERRVHKQSQNVRAVSLCEH